MPMLMDIMKEMESTPMNSTCRLDPESYESHQADWDDFCETHMVEAAELADDWIAQGTYKPEERDAAIDHALEILFDDR